MSKRSSSGMATRSSSKTNGTAINALLNPSQDTPTTPVHDEPTGHDDSGAHDDHSDSGSVKRQSLRIKSHAATPAAKPKRKRILPEQFKALAELFERTDTPNYELRDELAQKLNMTNREVQVWFQNRRAKFNRARQQQQRHQQELRERQNRWHEESIAIYPGYQQPRWPEENHCNHHYNHPYHHQLNQNHNHNHYQQEPSPCESLLSNASSPSSTSSSPLSPYPALSPGMAPLDILAVAADYIQRCDQMDQRTKRRRIEPATTTPLSPQITGFAANHSSPMPVPPPTKSWRPWV